MIRRLYWTLILLAFAVLVACQDKALPTQAPLADTPQPAVTPIDESGTVSGSENPAPAAPTLPPATPTPTEPLAALINGHPITLADFQKELARYEQAQTQLGLDASDRANDYQRIVLDALIETAIITQAAEDQGITVTDEQIDARLTELEGLSGGGENFDAWLEANQLTRDEFRSALATEMLTEQMVTTITADVSTTEEQVRARYIQVDDPTLAQNLLDQIRNGADFETLAQQNSLDRVTGENGGDLGFFSHNSLLVPEVEEAAFTLEPGQTSEVITAPRADGSGTTYYLVQVIERDPQRELTADTLFVRLQERFEDWLAQQKAKAEIIQYVETGS